MDAKKAEALESLNAITGVIEASHRIVFPGRTLMLYGVLILVIPVIEKGTEFLTFGNAALMLGSQKMVEAAIAAMILMMCALGKPVAIFPLAFLFIAILFQFYGRFTKGPLKFASWLLLLAGLAYGVLLTVYDPEGLWFVFSGVLGGLCLWAGWVLHREAAWNSN